MPEWPDLHIGATLGILLVGSLTAGLLAERLRLPKVTAYLGIGILFGPSVLDVVPHEHVLLLNPLLKLAMGLVLFQLGSQFTFRKIGTLSRRLAPLSIAELTCTFCLVAATVWVVTGSLPQGLLLGALALATAPATTMLVLKESESEGPLTDLTGGLVAINNFASIVVFELIFLAIHVIGTEQYSTFSSDVFKLLLDVIGAAALGVVAGLAVSFSCGLMRSSRWLVLLVASTSLVLGLCETFHVPYMLAFLAMGLVTVNTSNRNREIQAELKHLTGLLTVTFFVIHGTELDLISLVKAGAIGVVYIVARSAGKYFGIRVAAGMMHEHPDIGKWLGTCLLAQAGAAIALSAIAVERDPELGRSIQTVILGTVVVFELAGPILIRHSIREAGEVPIRHAIVHTSATIWQQTGDWWSRVQTALRRSRGEVADQSEVLGSQLVRSRVPPIRENASFDDVLRTVEHSHDDTFAVVDETGGLVGIIRYRKLAQSIFDPSTYALIRAVDAADSADVTLHPDDTITQVLAKFREVDDDCLPVVESDGTRMFRGMVRRRDVARQFLVDSSF